MATDRIIYATLPDKLEYIKRAGKRNCLLSVYYVKTETEILKEWWNFVQPKLLFLDSGVHTFKSRMGITNTVYNTLSEEAKKLMVAPKKLQTEVQNFTTKYIDFLEKYNDYFSYAFELDVDEFMGIELADRYYEELVDRVGYEKIIKVWHTTRTFEDWMNWCKNPKMSYLSIEGGTRHNWNPNFYRPFIKFAKEHNTKVHVLAATSNKLLGNVNIDTVDSSSWRTGARFGTVTVPKLGKVSFSNKLIVRNTLFSNEEIEPQYHYNQLSIKNRKVADDWLTEIGFTADELINGDPTGEWKNVANLYWYDKYVDLPYTEKPQKVSIL